MKFWWGVGALFVVLAVYFCLAPVEEIPNALDYNDKLSHLVGHGLLALYFSGLVDRRSWWKLLLFLVLLGVAIEVAQHVMRLGRQGDVRDVAANTAGAALGLLLGRVGLARWPQWIDRLFGQKAPT